MGPTILVTAFGPFPGVERNPSREVAAALESVPPAGVRVITCELPVTFEGAPAAVDAFVNGCGDRPDALVGLGVQGRGTLRLERRARARLDSERPDNDGLSPSDLKIDLGQDLQCALDVAELAEELRAAGAPNVEVSSDAGGYVCERTYHQLLARGMDLGVPALFLHVPPVDAMPPQEQVVHVRTLLTLLSRRLATTG